MLTFENHCPSPSPRSLLALLSCGFHLSLLLRRTLYQKRHLPASQFIHHFLGADKGLAKLEVLAGALQEWFSWAFKPNLCLQYIQIKHKTFNNPTYSGNIKETK